ncbi:MAG: hypothetical protein ACI3YC_00060 [Alloprevotella sp.]
MNNLGENCGKTGFWKVKNAVNRWKTKRRAEAVSSLSLSTAFFTVFPPGFPHVFFGEKMARRKKKIEKWESVNEKFKIENEKRLRENNFFLPWQFSFLGSSHFFLGSRWCSSLWRTRVHHYGEHVFIVTANTCSSLWRTPTNPKERMKTPKKKVTTPKERMTEGKKKT